MLFLSHCSEDSPKPITVRAHTFPTLSDSFSYPFRPFAHLRYSFTTAPRFPRSLPHLFPSPISTYRPCLFLISTVSPFGLLLFPPTPIFPPIPTSVASLSHRCFGSFLSHLRSPPFPRSPHSLRAVGILCSAFSHACSTFPTDRENSLTLAPLFVTFHCGHALLFSGHSHASKQYIRRAPCTIVSSDSI